jgi:hypothetical protein
VFRRNDKRSGETTMPRVFDSAALNMLPTTFPPAVWVKMMQLDIVVGRQARAYMPISISGENIFLRRVELTKK